MADRGSVRIGWDIGGAHLKACLLRHGQVADVAQWACPLWQGLNHLERGFAEAARRWPEAHAAQHAVTMTGEMADLFAHREAGVREIAACFTGHWGTARTRFFAGDAGWCAPQNVAAGWANIASANWLATARHVAQCVDGDGVLIDIGSTTTDLIAWRAHRVATTARSDAERLATGELVYQGVVRTPLCVLGPRVRFGGVARNVMNEFFATTADVYRLLGQLDPAHDLQPAADSGAKDSAATQQRLARMIGLDARDADAAQWLAFAAQWREAQVAEIAGQLQAVRQRHGLGAAWALVSAGAGDFLVPALAPAGTAWRRYADIVAQVPGQAGMDPALADRVQLCAPSVAVAALMD